MLKWFIQHIEGIENNENFISGAVDAKYIHTNLAVHSLKAYSNKFGKHISIASIQ